MLYSIIIKPYGQNINDKDEYIEEFTEKDIEIILDLYRSLTDKCKKNFPVINHVEVQKESYNTIVIFYGLEEKVDDEELLFYIESLIGLRSDNIISFGKDDYAIRGKPQVNTDVKKCEKTCENTRENTKEDFFSNFDENMEKFLSS